MRRRARKSNAKPGLITFSASSVAPRSGSLVVSSMRNAAAIAGSATITNGHLHPACGPALNPSKRLSRSEALCV